MLAITLYFRGVSFGSSYVGSIFCFLSYFRGESFGPSYVERVCLHEWSRWLKERERNLGSFPLLDLVGLEKRVLETGILMSSRMELGFAFGLEGELGAIVGFGWGLYWLFGFGFWRERNGRKGERFSKLHVCIIFPRKCRFSIRPLGNPALRVEGPTSISWVRKNLTKNYA